MSDWKEKIIKKAKEISDGVPDVKNVNSNFEIEELPSVFRNQAMAKILQEQGYHDYAKQILAENKQFPLSGTIKDKKIGKLTYSLKEKITDKDDFFLELSRKSNKIILRWSIGSAYQNLFRFQPESSLILILSFVISTSVQELSVNMPPSARAGELVLSDPGFNFRAVLVLKNSDLKTKLLFSDFCF